MNQNILHVGLDVDDTQHHGSAFNKATGEAIDFRCRPTLKGLLTQLDKLQRHFQGLSIRLCYEASYVGFHVQRDLRAHGVHCDVVAPSSIPSPRGKAIKTDRIDAGFLAQFYANDLLTVVQPPDEEQEQDRDLLRTTGVLELRRERLRWLLPVMVIFLVIVFFFGREILGFFRPEFAREGLTALYLLAVTTTITVLFSLAPTYLKYMGHNRTMLRTVIGAAALQVILLVLLVPRFAATGAALAYALSMCGMYLVFSRMAYRELVTLRFGVER